jgi:hypothetical protein
VANAFEGFLVQSRQLAGQHGPGQADAFVAELLRPYHTSARPVNESKAYVRIMQLFNGQAIGSDLPGVAGTRWAMLNAVTELVDHERGRSNNTRMESAWFGTGAALKARADLLADAAGRFFYSFLLTCDTIDQALAAVAIGRPAVVAAPTGTTWPYTAANGVRFVQCPAELADNFSCAQCGNGRPLCARGDRDYVVVFVAHGQGARLVGTDVPGGCYGNGGPVRLAWEKTKTGGLVDDAAASVAFARSLPPGSLLRHHIVFFYAW